MSKEFWPTAVKVLISLQALALLAYLVFSVLHFKEYFALTLVAGVGLFILVKVYGSFMGDAHQEQNPG